MAKKRRRTRNRTQATPGGAVHTAERPADPQRDAVRTAARPGGPTRTRAEKKELARRQRDEIRRRVRRAQRARQLLWVSGAALVIAVGTFVIFRPNQPTTRPETLPGELRTEAPWPANSAQAGDRADLIGLPGEGSAMHIHPDVQVFVRGQQETVPTGIGVTDTGATSLHTHSADGVVHIESASARDFTLGEFFDVWGVRLSSTCLGGYCEKGRDALVAFKDGTRVQGSIRGVVLDDKSVIVVTFGKPDELPNPIPSTFDFGSVSG